MEKGLTEDELKQILFSNVESLTKNEFSQCYEIQRLKLRKVMIDQAAFENRNALLTFDVENLRKEVQSSTADLLELDQLIPKLEASVNEQRGLVIDKDYIMHKVIQCENRDILDRMIKYQSKANAS